MRILVFLAFFLTVGSFAEAFDYSYKCQQFGGGDNKGKYNIYLGSSSIIFQAPFYDMDDCKAAIKLLSRNERKVIPVPSSPIINFFHMNGPNEDVGFPMDFKFFCRDHHLNNHLAESTNGYLDEECVPDTLYSWGGAAKALWFLENMPDNGNWPVLFSRSLFTTRSAAGTFGYGVFPLRFKRKSNVKFRLFINPKTYKCEDLHKLGYTISDLQNTIFTRVEINKKDEKISYSFQDYIICSPKVIASWSFGYTYHFDEILSDHIWMTTRSTFDWDAYSKSGDTSVYLNNNIDKEDYHTDFSLETFRKRMFFLRAIGDYKLGYLATERGQQGNRSTHFETNKPIYFNPK